MDFFRVLPALCQSLDDEDVRYALIGGFGMAMRGVQRATLDLDFILALDDLKAADKALKKLSFERYFHSENVSHYRRDDESWRVDLLHAFRKPALAMLERAERLAIEGGPSVPVAAVEDIIGLKVQALSNDPSRAEQDGLDIRLLVRAAKELDQPLDWELIQEYFDLFGQQDLLNELKGKS
ncbi:MAG: nucleotidyl transferase AbiEii/AbiGii toxin family protein [Wenzhouxiangella sp.]|jgi:hypothetical protein|nr:nucleotidyl transferase AbiEii/AbiGii toxin family protein [Wenzhouxiangella sp.]